MTEPSVPATVATVYGEGLPGAAPSRSCELVVIDGPDMGRALPLDDERERVVGSGTGCDLRLTDERVSRRHLAIKAEQGRFRVRDLGSRNGTLYEGARLRDSTVPAGATVKVGRSYLRLQPRPAALEIPASRSRRLGDLVGQSLAMREVFAVLELLAQSAATVLLEGETGTGKELAARALHDESPRRQAPFVAVDCGALPESLVESELYGHVRGAFTGAVAAREGAFARAHGGTLFLDEVTSIPLPVQARLLRAIEARRVRPVGSDRDRAVDVRLVAAAQEGLDRRVAEGSFRPDLFYRLSVVRVSLPPLRSRREDIPLIVAELLRRQGLEPEPVEGPSLDLLLTHAWPGNVRELRNVIERGVALSPGSRRFRDLRIALAPQAGGDEGLAVRADLTFSAAKRLIVAGFERRYLADLMARAGGNISAAARTADIDRKHLRELLERHRIPLSGRPPRRT